MHNEKLIKGLYDYREEHDACGIEFCMRIWIIKGLTTSLINRLKCCDA